MVKQQALEFKPKLLVAGYSSYPRHFDYARLRKICDAAGCLLMADIAHISGLISSGVAPNAFEFCDVVMTTTHKTLRGPRGAIIFAKAPHHEKIWEAVFPGFFGGPHNHTIAAIAVALKEAASPEFKAYSAQCVKNAQALGQGLMNRGIKILTGGTDNHIVLVDLRNTGTDGATVEHLFNHVNLSVNKNTLKGDVSAIRPSGLRLGSPVMTTRSANEKHFDQIAQFVKRGIDISSHFTGHKKIIEMKKAIDKAVKEDKEIIALKEDIIGFARSLPFYDHN